MWLRVKGLTALRRRSRASVTRASGKPVLRPRYRLSLVKHQRSLTMFLLTRAGNPARSAP